MINVTVCHKYEYLKKIKKILKTGDGHILAPTLQWVCQPDIDLVLMLSFVKYKCPKEKMVHGTYLRNSSMLMLGKVVYHLVISLSYYTHLKSKIYSTRYNHYFSFVKEITLNLNDLHLPLQKDDMYIGSGEKKF